VRSILQTTEWAEFKKTQGFEILHLGEIFVHKRSLPLGQSFLYLPEVDTDDINPAQLEELKKITREQKSVFARVEFLNPFSENFHKLIRSMRFVPAFEQVQPKWRQIVDLAGSEEEILAGMRPKGRYNIRLAERHQVRIQISKFKVQNDPFDATQGHPEQSRMDDNEKLKIVETFYKLYNETTRRERISGRSLEYFQNMVDKFKGSDYLEIYIATYRGEPVAAATVSFCGGVASYLYGGSSREHKEVMAPYLLHWQVMRDAKERGCKAYDLIGRSAPGKEDKWSGVTRFKEQFGGKAVEVLGSYDYVNKPTWYWTFKTVEKLRGR